MTHDSEYMKKMAAIADEYSKRDVSYKTYSAPLPAEFSKGAPREMSVNITRLTAAAPDLLAALQELVDFAEPIPVGHRDRQRSVWAFAAARAAIAKATR